jgi:hypothetical protein
VIAFLQLVASRGRNLRDRGGILRLICGRILLEEDGFEHNYSKEEEEMFGREQRRLAELNRFETKIKKWRGRKPASILSLIQPGSCFNEQIRKVPIIFISPGFSIFALQ